MNDVPKPLALSRHVASERDRRTTTAAILAGGQARRFGGRPKALLPLGDQRIIDLLLAVVRSVAEEVLVVASADHRLDDLGVPILDDLRPGTGPLGGIYTALVTSRSPQTLVVAADMPFLNRRFLEHLLQAGRDVDVAVPRTRDGRQPLCASYGQRCVALIERCLDARTLKVSDAFAGTRLIEIGPEAIAPFDPEGTLCFNINTPADYARALAVAAAGTAQLGSAV